jgi:hypothetical protein
MAKSYCKVWMPLSSYTAKNLPFPKGPIRAGEHLGDDRRLTVLHGRHRDGDIEIRRCDGTCGPCTDACKVKPGEWVSAEYALSLLIGPQWEPIGPVQVLAYELVEAPAGDPADSVEAPVPESGPPTDAPAAVKRATEGPEPPEDEREGDAPVLAQLAALFETLGRIKEEPARLKAIEAEIKFVRRQWRIAWKCNPSKNKIKRGYHQ